MNSSIQKLLKIMAQLRDPEKGCPWDCEQTFSSIVPHTIEETYEVVDCVEREDYAHLKEELGDLLFQVVFLSRIAEEQGLFNFKDVAESISDKLVRRHPHVFDDLTIESEEQLKETWEKIKQQEKVDKQQASQTVDHSVLANVEASHPAMTHAYKLQKAAASVGFDWSSAEEVLDKVDEELSELKSALLATKSDAKAVEHELGDLVFAIVNLARHISVKPETALRKVNYRFARRFRYMESKVLEKSQDMKELSLSEMEVYWRQAKLKVG